MNFYVRQANLNDVDQLFELSKQFNLLNLPSDKKVIESKIATSIQSFDDELDKEKSKYMLVGIDSENNNLIGCSQIIGQKGSEDNPSYCYELLKKEKFSPDLSVGFIHQILRLKIDTNGPTEIGGLIVDKRYRKRPEKIGKLISLARFKYIGLRQKKFKKRILSEMAPPLTEDGRSEFWDALGRRFTGMPYQEADLLSQQNKEFIKSLFPEEDIYSCLLDAKARLVMGRVSNDTQPALHMLEKIGFKKINEVDPFDGGPHLEVKVADLKILQDSKLLKLSLKETTKYKGQGLVSVIKKGVDLGGESNNTQEDKDQFFSFLSPFVDTDDGIQIPLKTCDFFNLEDGDELFLYPLN